MEIPESYFKALSSRDWPSVTQLWDEKEEKPRGGLKEQPPERMYASVWQEET